MSDPLFIRQIIAQVLSGQIRVPTFQRGFVWDADLDEILERAICPKSLFNDNFKTFVDERSELLALEANKLVS